MLARAVIWMMLALIFYTWAVFSGRRQGLHSKHLVIFGAGLVCDFFGTHQMNLFAAAYGKAPQWHNLSGILSLAGMAFQAVWAGPLPRSAVRPAQAQTPGTRIAGTAHPDDRPAADPKIVAALVTALKDQSAEVRREAAATLAGLRSPQALDALVAATADADSDVREFAVRAISRQRSDAVTQALVRALKDDDPQVRRTQAEKLRAGPDRGLAVPGRATRARRSVRRREGALRGCGRRQLHPAGQHRLQPGGQSRQPQRNPRDRETGWQVEGCACAQVPGLRGRAY